MRDGFGGRGGRERGEVRYEWQERDGSFIRREIDVRLRVVVI